ncbi:MAG: SusD/RagB family nutrient-binding outer membrane lipoprotein [Saprospiraceae bacterium]|nr:SusD/RagB family nutrient-binding outer membrane lipoprotein [Saprospiraceae bacterium]
MRLLKYISILVLAWGITACEMTDLDLQVDPNQVAPDQASVNDLYNNIQLEFRNVFTSSQGTPGAMARMYHAGDFLYQTVTSPTTLNGLWFNAYADLFPDIDALLAITDQSPGVFDIHAGSAKIMKAYTLMTLVDLLGNVPLAEAGQGTDVISPTSQDGASIYENAISLLDDAIGQLTGTSAGSPAVELFYGGNADNWIAAANTLKLRAAINTRLVDGSAGSTVSALLSSNLIDDASEDFQFRYGTERNNPNSRHPFYNSHYEVGDGPYLSNYYMWLLHASKLQDNGARLEDPRIRYYFYKKVEDAQAQDATTYSCFYSILPDQSAKPDHVIAVDPNLPYCVVPGSGYSGRDHLNGEGIPPDGPIRTSYGLYPGGGQFDYDQYEDTRQRGTSGGLGQGILPLFLSSFTHFMRAEAALTLGTSDDARTQLEAGIRASMAKVLSFESLVPATMATTVTDRNGSSTVKERYAASSGDVDAYVAYVLGQYDAAGSNEERLAVVIMEYYLAAWGNGLEAYNMYRRTGYPAKIQPGLQPEVGAFARSLFLPAVHVDRNANATQKTLTDRVFWDDGSTNLY